MKQILDIHDVVSMLAQTSNFWYVYISFDAGSSYEDIIASAPYLGEIDSETGFHKYLEVLDSGIGVIRCSSKQEALDICDQTECDHFKKGVAVYAIVYNNNGIAVTENT